MSSRDMQNLTPVVPRKQTTREAARTRAMSNLRQAVWEASGFVDRDRDIVDYVSGVLTERADERDCVKTPPPPRSRVDRLMRRIGAGRPDRFDPSRWS